jgi:hypothetical protein
MASGDIVGFILDVLPPATLFPQPYIRQGGSTPAERVLVYGFDAATIEYLDFKVQLQGYDGGGLTVVLPWSAASATTNSVQWGVAIRRVQDDAEDIDGSHTYDYNEVTDTCASASGELSYPTITFTNGADMDSWADGEIAIVRVRREADDATNDTMTGDAELWGIILKES